MAWFEIKYIIKWALIIALVVLGGKIIFTSLSYGYHYYERENLTEQHVTTKLIRPMHLSEMKEIGRHSDDTNIQPELYAFIVNLDGKNIAIPVKKDFFIAHQNDSFIKVNYRKDQKGFYFDEVEAVK